MKFGLQIEAQVTHNCCQNDVRIFQTTNELVTTNFGRRCRCQMQKCTLQLNVTFRFAHWTSWRARRRLMSKWKRQRGCLSRAMLKSIASLQFSLSHTHCAPVTYGWLRDFMSFANVHKIKLSLYVCLESRHRLYVMHLHMCAMLRHRRSSLYTRIAPSSSYHHRREQRWARNLCMFSCERLASS